MKIWQVWASATGTNNGKSIRKNFTKGYIAETRELAKLKMVRELVDSEWTDIKVRACKLVSEENL